MLLGLPEFCQLFAEGESCLIKFVSSAERALYSGRACFPLGILFIIFLMFIYFLERDRPDRQTDTKREQGGAERERESHGPKQAPGSKVSARSPTQGLNPRTVRS